jgi:pyruvoyl-dependent arginine decarboxylase (PvlArgDC)
VTCTETRDRLPEHVLGSTRGRDRRDVERHLTWCAACRKEFDELARAAAVLPYALEAADPPEDLEDRVVGAVTRAARARRPAARRGRTIAAVLLAAAITVGSLGWGMAMAHRAGNARAQAAEAQRLQELAIKRFSELLDKNSALLVDPRNRLSIGTLVPSVKAGGGVAITLTSPTLEDFAFVVVNGLPAPAEKSLPYQVVLTNQSGKELVVGKLSELDGNGGAQIFQDFPLDLGGYTSVTVRDAAGKTVMSGTVGPSSLALSPPG